MIKVVLLKNIDKAKSPQVRSEIRNDVAEEYSERYKLGKEHGMPPPILYKVGSDYLIADGWHRITAMEMVGIKSELFDVCEGTAEACLIRALKANSSHGLRRTNADKRASAMLAIKKFPNQSNASLADMCGVGDDLIAEIRKQLETKGEVKKTATRTSANGTEMKVAKKQVASQPTLVDSTGYPIPENVIPQWKRKPESVALVDNINSIRSQLKQAKEDKDLFYCEVNFNAIEADLERAVVGLSLAIPYAVCPTCQGKVLEKCKMCNGRGLISKFRYGNVPEELKKIREIK